MAVIRRIDLPAFSSRNAQRYQHSASLVARDGSSQIVENTPYMLLLGFELLGRPRKVSSSITELTAHLRNAFISSSLD